MKSQWSWIWLVDFTWWLVHLLIDKVPPKKRKKHSRERVAWYLQIEIELHATLLSLHISNLLFKLITGQSKLNIFSKLSIICWLSVLSLLSKTKLGSWPNQPERKLVLSVWFSTRGSRMGLVLTPKLQIICCPDSATNYLWFWRLITLKQTCQFQPLFTWRTLHLLFYLLYSESPCLELYCETVYRRFQCNDDVTLIFKET